MNGPFSSTDNVFDWIKAQHEESGITNLVDHAAIVPYLEDLAGYKIPYFDRDGSWIPNYYRIRVHPKCQTAYNGETYRPGEGISKYWQKPGQKQRIYWPPVVGVNHISNIGDVSRPIFICEGEKKALKLQYELLVAGIEASVLGVPGVRLAKEIVTELQTIPWSASSKHGNINRPVYLVFDFNDAGAGESDTRKGEDMVFATLAMMHADIMFMRWDCLAEDGVQKIDDWLVAGGDLKAAIKESTANKALDGNKVTRGMLGMNEHWAQYKGVYVMIDGPNKGSAMAKTPFLDSNAHLKIVALDGKGKPRKIFIAHEWIEWAGKRTMDGFCFIPPALGSPLQEWDGGRLNVSGEWLPIGQSDDLPWDEQPELPTHMIHRLLENFCESEAQFKFLCQFMAHMLLHPDQTTSQCIAIIDNGGTGKGILANSIIKLGQGKLANMIELDRKDQFNGELIGLVAGFADELMRGGISGKDLEAINKRLVGNEYITVNEKHQPVKTVRNYLRLFYFVNTKYPFHIARDDRRMNVFSGRERIGPPTDDATSGNGFYSEYLDFMNSAVFVQTWLAFCTSQDLSAFNPHSLGPISKARILAMDASATAEEEFMLSEQMSFREVITSGQLKEAWENFNPRQHMTTNKLTNLLERNGWHKRSSPIKHMGKTTDVYAKTADWDDKSPQEWSDAAKKTREDGNDPKF